MRSKFFVFVSLLILVSMLLASCQTATQAPAAPAATATTAAPAVVDALRINLTSYPDNLDPQKASFVSELAHLKLVYEALTRLDKDLKTVPGSAEKWEYNADATQVTFTIRKGLKYSDGSLLNAKRFEYSILRNIDPNTAGEYATITDDIAGAAAWRGADLKKATPDELKTLKANVKVEAQDAAGKPCTGYDQADCLSLKIGLAQSAPYIHVVMGLWVTYPAKQELIEKGGDKWYMDVKNQIGNGPLIWKTNEEKVKGEFVPNPNYYRGVAKVGITFTYIVDTATAFAAYKNNELDIIGLGAEDLGVAKADATLAKEIQQYPGSCTYAVMFHQTKEPFTDPKVRQAFAQATDRVKWVADVLKGLGVPTLTWIPKGYPGYDATETRWGFDPAAAKKALSESKYGSVDKLPPISLTFSDSPRNRTRYEWLAAQWKEVLGVDVKLNPTEATAYTALTKNVDTAPQVYILGWCADYPDPQNWLSVYWMTGAFGARLAYSNKDLDALMKKADAELNADNRMKLYNDAQKMLTTDLPAAYMWNSVNIFLVKPAVKGVVTTPQDSGWAGENDVLTLSISK
jgi:oligopeptide transport system substrate-binding protein